MYKWGKIIASLVVFIALISLPFLYNIRKSSKGPVINLNSPAIRKLAVKQCVEPAKWMLANHMILLNQWRNEYVRDGKTVYINSQGKSFENNLQTCVNCHYDPAVKTSDQFCVSCHDHTAVNPDCWICHILPKGAKQ